jgi:hypothetical protein
MYDTVGNRCDKLTREYSQAMVEDQVSLMGGFVTNMETKNDGELHMTVSI